MGSADAIAALQSDGNVSVQRIEGFGYGFLTRTAVIPLEAMGGPSVTSGGVIIP